MDTSMKLQLARQERQKQVEDDEKAFQELISQAESLAVWITEWMVKHKTSNVEISNTYSGMIEIIDYYNGGFKHYKTFKSFRRDVVKEMVKLLNKEDGYSAEFKDGHSPNSYDWATIKMT